VAALLGASFGMAGGTTCPRPDGQLCGSATVRPVSRYSQNGCPDINLFAHFAAVHKILQRFSTERRRRDERVDAHGEWNRRWVVESEQILRVPVMQRSPIFRTITGLLVLATTVTVPVAAQARLQCVTYARQISAVQLSGNARDWWGHADGVYARGNAPRKGAVLAFRGTHAMPMGHVAVVSKVIDDRHVLISHANWSRHGAVEKGVMAVDVSNTGDWSQVRVWYGPTASLGLRPSPAFGFIYPATTTASKADDSDSDAG